MQSPLSRTKISHQKTPSKANKFIVNNIHTPCCLQEGFDVDLEGRAGKGEVKGSHHLWVKHTKAANHLGQHNLFPQNELDDLSVKVQFLQFHLSKGNNISSSTREKRSITPLLMMIIGLFNEH